MIITTLLPCARKIMQKKFPKFGENNDICDNKDN